MKAYWEENTEASRPQWILYCNGQKLITVGESTDLHEAKLYRYARFPGHDSVELAAATMDEAKKEAIDMVYDDLRETMRALEPL